MRRIIAWMLVLCGAALAQRSFVAAADVVRPSLVSIVTDKVAPAGSGDQNGPTVVQTQELGSGFVLDTLGNILTCNHVVALYKDVTVRFSDKTAYGGKDVIVVGQDPVTDLAVVHVKAARKFVPAQLGNSDELQVGQQVMALGSPFGLEGTATAGIVSAVSRWGLAKSSGPDFQDFIQTDALINPGNSGGPLVDLEGRVVGVNSFIRTMKSGPTGIGFATPINLARSVADQLIENGKVVRGYLGISTQPVTEGIRQALGLRTRDGVLVSSVEPGKPGSKAGLVPGDAIVALDDKPIPDARWFQSEIATRQPGSTVRFSLVRKGRAGTATVVLGAWPTIVAEAQMPPDAKHWLGLVVHDGCVAEPAQGEPECGIAVAEVEGGSPAAEANLKPGDVITEVNLAPVRNKADFDQIEKTMAGIKRPLLFRVFRGRQVFYTALEP